MKINSFFSKLRYVVARKPVETRLCRSSGRAGTQSAHHKEACRGVSKDMSAVFSKKIIVASVFIALFSSQPLVAWEWPWQKKKTVEDKRLDLQRRQINDPTNPYINYNMGVIQYKKQQFDAAAASFDRAMQHVPDKPFFKKQVYFNLGQTEYRRAQGAVGPSWQKEKVSDELIDKALVLTDQSIKQFDAVLVLEAEHARAKKMKDEVELFQKKLLAKKYENQQKKDQQNPQDNKDNKDKNKQKGDGKDQDGKNKDGDEKDDGQQGDDKDKQGKAGDKKNKDGKGKDEKSEQGDADQKKDQQSKDDKDKKDEQKGDDPAKQKDGNDDKSRDDEKLEQAKDRGRENGKDKGDKNAGGKPGEKPGQKPKAPEKEDKEAEGEASDAAASNQQPGNEDTMERVMDAHTKAVLDAVEQMEGNAQKRAMAYELSKMGAQRVGGSQKPW